MNDFIYHNNCKVYFGRNQLHNLPSEVLQYGNRVLLVYGGGSIKRNGLYNSITALLNDNNITYEELSGVEPNPRHTTVNKGISICRSRGVDVIIAIGGGSVIDCSKAISTCSSYDGDDVWEIVKSGDYSGETIPVIAVLTIAATGSEMDPWAVISNPDTKEKICFSGANLLPRAAFENPELTFTLPSYQTACGSFDIFSHVLDDYYFSGENTFELTKQFQEAVMRTVLKYAPVALSTPSNYEARANLMWSSSVALNSMLDGGSDHKAVCHAIEHELSAYYDITHGHGLAIITPRWLEYCLNENTAPEIARLGRNVFGLSAELSIIECAEKTVKELYRFCFETLGLPDKLSDVGIDDKYFTEMAEHACSGSILHSLIDLNSQDIVNIFNMCL